METRIIFNDKQQDDSFKKNGYIVINLLEKKTAKEILKEVKKLDAGVDAPFYTSLWSSNPEYRKKVDAVIIKEIGEKVLPLFNNYTPFFGDLLVKKPSLSKDFPVHQDWTFVDEEIYTSVYVWCPLQDVSFLNGNLQVVEGSHLFLDKIRGANIKVSYGNIKIQIQKKWLKDIPLKAGQAIIFNQALLHASPPNRSFSTRIALGLLFLPKEADIFHYFYDSDEQKIMRLKVDKDFFMKYSENLDFTKSLQSSSFYVSLSGSEDKIPINITFENMNYEHFVESIAKIPNKLV